MACQLPETTFILGCQRSGTTILMRSLSIHKSYAWISQFLNLFPKHPVLAWLHRVYDVPIVGRSIRKKHHTSKFLPSPVEPLNVTEQIEPGFNIFDGLKSNPNYHLGKASKRALHEFRHIVAQICRYHGKQRFIAKFTARPDLAYLEDVFPGSRFIHIVRDPRAVVNSLKRKMEQGGWFKNKVREGVLRLLPQSYQEVINEYSNDTIAFLACYHCHIVSMIRRSAKCIPDQRFLEITYGAFANNIQKTLLQILDFLHLDFSSEYRDYLSSLQITSRNYKWRNNLNHSEIELIDEIRMGFL